MVRKKINKCRKCKSDAYLTYHHVDCYTTVYGVRCDTFKDEKCTNSIKGEKTEEAAIAYWNERNNI